MTGGGGEGDCRRGVTSEVVVGVGGHLLREAFLPQFDTLHLPADLAQHLLLLQLPQLDVTDQRRVDQLRPPVSYIR